MDMFPKTYVAGPMSGYPEHNFPAFDECARYLRGTPTFGAIVSPADLTRFDASKWNVPVGSRSWAYCMRQDLAEVVQCTHIVLLDGWAASRGARLEVTVALALELKFFRYSPAQCDEAASLRQVERDEIARIMELGLVRVDETKPVGVTQGFTSASPEPEPESVTAEADRIVSADRMAAYGHPFDNWSQIADLWNHHLKTTGGSLTAEDAVIMMILMKVARLETGGAGHRDSKVDIAGYSKVLDMIVQERKRRDETQEGS